MIGSFQSVQHAGEKLPELYTRAIRTITPNGIAAPCAAEWGAAHRGIVDVDAIQRTAC